jgi:transposase
MRDHKEARCGWAERAEGRQGRPRRRPDKLHADKGYDHCRCRRECWARSITPRIARRGIESSERLGRYRWIVERTLARLARSRRLAIRYEQRADPHLAFTTRLRPHLPNTSQTLLSLLLSMP